MQLLPLLWPGPLYCCKLGGDAALVHTAEALSSKRGKPSVSFVNKDVLAFL